MATLAPKLPWQHPFAGGYPGRSGQALPTDADAIDYLNRVAAADGASVEVGIAQAIEAFITGCKADSAGYAGDPTRTNWDAIKSACIMCGARTLSGALVSLRQYGPELWTGGNPNIISGSTGTWTAATQTFTHSGYAEYGSYPRAQWNYGVLKTGIQYKASVRLSGDLEGIYGVYVGNVVLSRVGATDEWAGTVTATGATSLLLYLRGQEYSSISVTLVSVSIKEVINDATNVANNFTSSDYSRSGSTPGIKGDGATKYLNTNRAQDADPQNDSHHSVYATDGGTSLHYKIGSKSAAGCFVSQRTTYNSGANRPSVYQNVAVGDVFSSTTLNGNAAGLYGASRLDATGFAYRLPGGSGTHIAASVTPGSDSNYVFAFNNAGALAGQFDGRLAFYSLGAALDLAALDTRVSNLVTAIKFHSLTGLLPNDYDPATIAYIVSGISAGGTL